MAKYEAKYKHYEIIDPDSDNIPPIFGYSRKKSRSFLFYIFRARNDQAAKTRAVEYIDEFYQEQREFLPDECKDLANRPTLEKLVELIPPRKIELS